MEIQNDCQCGWFYCITLGVQLEFRTAKFGRYNCRVYMDYKNTLDCFDAVHKKRIK